MKENVSLSLHTTMRVGGPARYFFEVHSVAELIDAVMFAKHKSKDFFVLGSGSNVIAPDRGFAGVIIKISLKDAIIHEEVLNGFVRVTASAGILWDEFVEHTVKHSLYGLENLSAIPGTVGACPVQNIGAYGAQVADSIESVSVLDVDTLSIRNLSNKECCFSYRDSVFKTQEGRRHIIISVTFLLARQETLNTSYRDVSAYFAERKIDAPTQQDVRNAIIAIREKKLPDPMRVGTAGSFFKNPIISLVRYTELKEQYEGLPGFTLPDGTVKVPAAWLIDKICHLKGVVWGGVELHTSQALALVNHGDASAEDVFLAIREIEKNVQKKTGITLETEVVILSMKA